MDVHAHRHPQECLFSPQLKKVLIGSGFASKILDNRIRKFSILTDHIARCSVLRVPCV